MSAAARRRIVPLRVRLYVGGVAATAFLLLPASMLITGTHFDLAAAVESLVLAALIAIAWRQPVRVGLKRKLNVGTAPAVAAVILLPNPLPALTLVAGAVAGEAQSGGPRYNGRSMPRSPCSAPSSACSSVRRSSTLDREQLPNCSPISRRR